MRSYIGGPSHPPEDDDDTSDEDGVEAVFFGLPQPPMLVGDGSDEDEDIMIVPLPPQPPSPFNVNNRQQHDLDDASSENSASVEDAASNLAEAGSLHHFSGSEENEDSPPVLSVTSHRIYVGNVRPQGLVDGGGEGNLSVGLQRYQSRLGRQLRDRLGIETVENMPGGPPEADVSRRNRISSISPFPGLRDDQPLRILTEAEAIELRSESEWPELSSSAQSQNNLDLPLLDNSAPDTAGDEGVQILEPPSPYRDAVLKAPTLKVNGINPESQEDLDDNSAQLPDYESQSTSPGSVKRKYNESDSDSDDDGKLKVPSKANNKNKYSSALSSPFFGGPTRSRRRKAHDDPSPLVLSTSQSVESSPFYSNPMESDLDAEIGDVDPDALRGDRIGNTAYSERNVLTLLIKWMNELKTMANVNTTVTTEENDEEGESESSEKKETSVPISAYVLDPSVDEELSLLWDLSSEPDVMTYLVEKNMYVIIKDTIDASNCARLKEIALGILANLLSSRALLVDFPKVDVSLKLISAVISEILVLKNEEVLVQAFCVLERIGWANNELEPNLDWIVDVLTLEFVNAVNFLLASSRDVLLLGKIIVTIQSLFQTLSRTNVFGSSDEVVDENDESEVEMRMTRNFDVFCETAFLPSLCEGLNELLKCSSENEAEVDIDDVEIPPGHVQTSLCSGLGCLCYLQSFKSGQALLRDQSPLVSTFLKDFFAKFHLYTEQMEIDSAFEYFASAVSLMSFCHRGLSALDPSVLLKPIQAANRLVTKREELKDMDKDKDSDLRNSIAIVVHEHLAELGDTFGSTAVSDSIEEDTNLNSFMKFVQDTANNFADKDKQLEIAQNGECESVPLALAVNADNDNDD